MITLLIVLCLIGVLTLLRIDAALTDWESADIPDREQFEAEIRQVDEIVQAMREAVAACEMR